MLTGCVDRCVCFRKTFTQWLREKRMYGWTMEEAAQRTRCGEGCGACKPYLCVVAATGRTVIPVMSYEEALAYREEADSPERKTGT